MYRNDYIKDNNLQYMYIDHSDQFADFMERSDYSDRVLDITP